ncbi:hypothetical protein [Bacillus sp. T3]|uniref:hypothetical protein n=1 Tax=Bacillus sp. T3 TaxID=467262 RepID=UPI002980D197|nr:hypothetical protein [Bacillus sp. T3]
MNINGVAREYMARFQSGEEFFKQVADQIERQLKEWDPQYEVFLMRFSYYELVIKNGEQYYNIQLTYSELDSLQKKAPYALDRKIWKDLNALGLPIIKGYGNYIESIL